MVFGRKICDQAVLVPVISLHRITEQTFRAESSPKTVRGTRLSGADTFYPLGRFASGELVTLIIEQIYVHVMGLMNSPQIPPKCFRSAGLVSLHSLIQIFRFK